NIYRLSQGLNDNARIAVLRSVANYLKTAINVDWPTMDQGVTGTRAARGATRQTLDAVYAALVSSSGQGDSTVVSEMFRQVDLITQSRRARLVLSEGAVPKAMWPILLGGAAITIGFTFFFVTQRLLTQVLMTALLAILILSELLIIVSIDRPFSGAVKIGPNALAAVLTDVEAWLSDSRSPLIEPSPTRGSNKGNVCRSAQCPLFPHSAQRAGRFVARHRRQSHPRVKTPFYLSNRHSGGEFADADLLNCLCVTIRLPICTRMVTQNPFIWPS